MMRRGVEPVSVSSSSSSSVSSSLSISPPVNLVLGHKTANIRDLYKMGRKLGQGQFGTTYLCTEISTGIDYACKSIAKRKLVTKEDVEDVRREIQIMHHLSGHDNVVTIKGAYEDPLYVHIVMKLCSGGELFDRIIERGYYSERKAAELTRIIVGVVEACHSLGVMHRDLKPENFLLVNKDDDLSLKAIDFGLSVFFKPGQKFREIVGSPYYLAPEVLSKHYGPEADVWTAGVILYILLSGVPPFWAETQQGIFDAVRKGHIDFDSDPWPMISNSAKDLIRKMLCSSPSERLTAHQVLCDPWICEYGVAPDRAMDPAVLSRLKQFSAMNRLKKMAFRVIAESLSEEEIAGLREMFRAMDTDSNGVITFDELKSWLGRYGSTLRESEIRELMEAADVDNSGTIDFGEFIAATVHINKLEREEHLAAAFAYFDKDGSGYITIDELQDACKEHNMTDTLLDDIIKEVDQDNDGRIDYGEFVAMMRTAETRPPSSRFLLLSAAGDDGRCNAHGARCGYRKPSARMGQCYNRRMSWAVLYIKREFQLQTEPTIEGLIVAMSLIGATIITFISGPVSDSVGRRPMLILSSIFYFFSGLVMLWSPNVYVLLLARLIDGFGIGLAVTLVPLYISEISPPETRGLLNTFPQFTGSVGMFASYIMVFFMSLLPKPDWRFMLSVLSIPSLVYLFLAVFYLPESPRWLVSKGRMNEANKVLRELRGTDDVSGEMALLFEGLEVGGQTSIEEYMVGPADNKIGEGGGGGDDGLKKGVSLIARPGVPRNGSIEIQKSIPFMDPLVTLFGSVHEKASEMGGSTLFPNLGSMLSFHDQQQQQPKNDHWDVENNEVDQYIPHGDGNYSDDNDDELQQLRSPLLSREATGMELKESCSVVIGGGWQLAWKQVEDGEGFRDGFKRIYLHQENDPAENEFIPAAALVTQSTHFAIHPAEEGLKGTQWRDLLEPGVRRALVVGVTLQILQQFAGINGVLYYTPQILSEAGVEVLFSDLGINSDSASFLISDITTFLMLPSISIAMWLMDKSGRRSLLLSTIPVLICSLLLLVVSSAVPMGTVVQAVLSTVSVIMYFCCFVMGFGPIPNILCAEIFPTRVRGLCIAICALTFWTCDIIVTYSLPLMLNWIGLVGLFGLYAVVCCIALLFVYLKVPETKGMPLEVITDFFAVESPPENTNL